MQRAARLLTKEQHHSNATQLGRRVAAFLSQPRTSQGERLSKTCRHLDQACSMLEGGVSRLPRSLHLWLDSNSSSCWSDASSAGALDQAQQQVPAAAAAPDARGAL